MTPLPEPLADVLEAFNGYVVLGMFAEASEELESLPPRLRAHVEVLAAQLTLRVEMGKWEDSIVLGQSLIGLYPDRCDLYIKTAYALHELKRTDEAEQTLLSGPESLREQPVFWYNLGCYYCQLGDLVEAKRHLTQCFELDKGYRLESLDDPDLEPLWDVLKKQPLIALPLHRRIPVRMRVDRIGAGYIVYKLRKHRSAAQTPKSVSAPAKIAPPRRGSGVPSRANRRQKVTNRLPTATVSTTRIERARGRQRMIDATI